MITSLGVLSKISDNIYLLDYKDGLEIDLKNSVEFRNQLTELIKDKKRLLGRGYLHQDQAVVGAARHRRPYPRPGGKSAYN